MKQKIGYLIERLMWRLGWQKVPHEVWTREKEHVPYYNSSKLTVAVDFDGVIHSYTSGWKGAANLPDPPVEGAIAWLNKLDKRFSVAILTTRAQTQEAVDAIEDYLIEHGYKGSMPLITDRKIPALMYVDDRGWRFDPKKGGFPDVDKIQSMKPWNKPQYHYGGGAWKGHTGKIAEKHSWSSGTYGQKGEIKIERVVTDLGDGQGERQIQIPYCTECGADAIVKFKNYFDCPQGHCHRRVENDAEVEAYKKLRETLPRDGWGNLVVPGDPDRSDETPPKKGKKSKGQQKLPGMGQPKEKGRTGGKQPKQIAASSTADAEPIVVPPMGSDATAEDMENWTDEEFDAWMAQEGLHPYEDAETGEVIYLSEDELAEIREIDAKAEAEKIQAEKEEAMSDKSIEIKIEPDEQPDEQPKQPEREVQKPENDPEQPKPQPVEQPQQ